MKKKSLMDLLKKLIQIVFSREFITYSIAGVLTTLVNYISFHLLCNIIGIEDLIANAIAWVLAVLFAYVVNAKIVFLQRGDSVKGAAIKVTKFFGARVVTFIVEELGILVFVELLGYNNLIVKACLSVIVIILNYIFSKLYIFK
ncbi:MAG: GtrA family protein [Herbinix sp.]|nr:GtrA family protein [Herbinix sp.]